MKIRIVSPSDISNFKPFFNEAYKDILLRNSFYNAAPAVNTLILFLKNGHSIRLFTLAKENFEVKGNGIEIFGIKKYSDYPIKFLWGDLLHAKYLRKCIKEKISDLEVLHAHWIYSYTYASAFFVDVLSVFVR